jgi:hypothetical protein
MPGCGVETAPVFQHTKSKHHGALESGDARLDNGSKPVKTVINSLAAAHISFAGTAFCGETDILDPARGCFGLFQIFRVLIRSIAWFGHIFARP